MIEMPDWSLLLITVFLPLFPLSMVFNALFAKVRQPHVRSLLLLGWPLIGLWIYQALQLQAPEWVQVWALGTAVFYAFRLVAMREVGIWLGYIATSVWSCLWLPLMTGNTEVLYYALWFNVPLAILALLVGGLEKRFGAAYTGLYGALAQSMPRFSGVFVVTVLAAVATPVFPAFLGMLKILVASHPLAALSLVVVWAVWSWAGMRLIQGMIVGDPADVDIEDMPMLLTWLFALLMLSLTFAGFTLTGGM